MIGEIIVNIIVMPARTMMHFVGETFTRLLNSKQSKNVTAVLKTKLDIMSLNLDNCRDNMLIME